MTAAYWVWIVAAVLLVLFGLLALTASGEAIRNNLSQSGVGVDKIGALINLLRGNGLICLLVGIAVGLLAGPVRGGDGRIRRALAALSVVFALLEVAAVVTELSPGVLLVVPILLLVAVVLAYRDSASTWFGR
ncbi:hypothetical protein FOS14_12385 [Skermania sp. ID1734]|uniref:hypothetical protein n=1 Tax=Skermania sp. ID1734 TaxID=2597516 RepID=UPI001180DB1F|nr:hypothetical protein [Skermania sp. ID1734]TSD99559.1 hypothetical protein FOS14_12385 [Skermania sp. ID1734]